MPSNGKTALLFYGKFIILHLFHISSLIFDLTLGQRAKQRYKESVTIYRYYHTRVGTVSNNRLNLLTTIKRKIPGTRDW